jgi:hypothetical protein
MSSEASNEAPERSVTENATADPSVAEYDLLEVAKALLDESRLIILGMTAQAPQTVEQLAAATGAKPAALPRHLEQLRDLGLLTAQASKGSESYRLDVKKLQEYKRKLFAGNVPARAESTEEQVLANFLRDGKLVTIPAQEAKKLVILRRLVEEFAPDGAYAERDVNLILSQFHEDFAALRRYLVEYGFLDRSAGVYRRAQAETAA